MKVAPEEEQPDGKVHGRERGPAMNLGQKSMCNAEDKTPMKTKDNGSSEENKNKQNKNKKKYKRDGTGVSSSTTVNAILNRISERNGDED